MESKTGQKQMKRVETIEQAWKAPPTARERQPIVMNAARALATARTEEKRASDVAIFSFVLIRAVRVP